MAGSGLKTALTWTSGATTGSSARAQDCQCWRAVRYVTDETCRPKPHNLHFAPNQFTAALFADGKIDTGGVFLETAAIPKHAKDRRIARGIRSSKKDLQAILRPLSVLGKHVQGTQDDAPLR